MPTVRQVVALFQHRVRTLVLDVKTLIAILVRLCRVFALVINFKAGKTECILALRGPHSQNMREKLYGVVGRAKPVPTETQQLLSAQAPVPNFVFLLEKPSWRLW